MPNAHPRVGPNGSDGASGKLKAALVISSDLPRPQAGTRRTGGIGAGDGAAVGRVSGEPASRQHSLAGDAAPPTPRLVDDASPGLNTTATRSLCSTLHASTTTVRAIHITVVHLHSLPACPTSGGAVAAVRAAWRPMAPHGAVTGWLLLRYRSAAVVASLLRVHPPRGPARVGVNDFDNLGFHVPPLGTRRRIRTPQPPPRLGGLAGTVDLHAGPKGGAASAPPLRQRLEASDRLRMGDRQPHPEGRIADSLQLPIDTVSTRFLSTLPFTLAGLPGKYPVTDGAQPLVSTGGNSPDATRRRTGHVLR
jgi:hypothetical protein